MTDIGKRLINDLAVETDVYVAASKALAAAIAVIAERRKKEQGLISAMQVVLCELIDREGDNNDEQAETNF